MKKGKRFILQQFLLGIICLFATLGAQSQGDLVKIVPKWKAGDVRNIRVDFTRIVEGKDSIITQENRGYDILFKVLEVNDHYLVRWTCTNDEQFLIAKEIPENMDAIDRRILEGFNAVKMEVLQAELIFQLDKKTGKAKEWIDGLQRLNTVEFQEKKKMREWCKVNNMAADARAEMELNFSKLLQAEYPLWRSKLLEKVSGVFEQYGLAFSLNKETQEKILTSDLVENQDEEVDFPATLTKKATEFGDRLTVKTTIDYDKVFLHSYFQKTQIGMEDLSLEDVLVIEKEQVIFDLTTNWIINYTKTLSFEVGDLKTVSKTSFMFN